MSLLMWKNLQLFLLLLTVLPVSVRANCNDFLRDSRFNWWRSSRPNLQIEIHRKPPNVFPSMTQSLVYRELRAIPNGLSLIEAKFFGGIFRLLRDLRRTYELIQDVVMELERDHKTLDQILSEFEKRYGFGLIDVQEALNLSQFMRVLSSGAVFHDSAGHHLSLMAWGTVLGDRWKHGRLSHRFQMHLVLRDFEAHPEYYGSPNPHQIRRLYSRMGSQRLHRSLDWAETGIEMPSNGSRPSLFFQLFDSPENNASNPGFFRAYQEYWPQLNLP